MKRKISWGRVVVTDERDSLYPIQPKKAPNRHSRTWSSSGWLGDQGYDSSCVGFGWAHWLHAEPKRQWLSPNGIYQIAKYMDEWNGESYEGTSVRAGAKVLCHLGLITEYRWTTDVDIVINQLLTTGPVVIGVDWFSGMTNVGSDGIMKPSGRIEGGHCICVTGWSNPKQRFKLKNSWGDMWGDRGYGYLSYSDMNKLLKRPFAECCVGLETKYKPS